MKLTSSHSKMRIVAILAFSLISFISSGQSNLEKFTPSVLLQKGQTEFSILNNFYTQKSARNADGNKFSLPFRQSFLNNSFSFLYGVSSNSKVNIGVETTVSTGIYEGQSSITSLASIGPKIKWSPGINNLSVQSTFLIPASNNLESPVFVAHDRYSWINQLFYDKALSQKWRLFMEVALWYRFKNNVAQNSHFFRTPISAILSFFPSSKFVLFANTQYAPRFETLKDGDLEAFGQTQWYNLFGFGAKYQISNKVGFELSYANFLRSRNDGAGQVFNLGIRLIN